MSGTVELIGDCRSDVRVGHGLCRHVADVLEDDGGNVVAVPVRLPRRANDVLCAFGSCARALVAVVASSRASTLEPKLRKCWRSSMEHQPLGPAALVSLARRSAARVKLGGY